MFRFNLARLVLALSFLVQVSDSAWAAAPDLILHSGKIITVDTDFSLAEAIAIEGGKIVLVGDDATVLATKNNETRLIDLQGQTVLPGLIDSHVHPGGASMFEFDHPVPEMESIADVLAFIRSRAAKLEPGTWIWVSQVFITRLEEQRYPTRTELDAAAPNHPVVFRTGPDASLNSLALKLSGIDAEFEVVGTGKIERNAKTGEPTGILRGCTRYIKSGNTGGKSANEATRRERLAELLADYNSVGITAIADRYAGDSSLAQFAQLLAEEKLTCRVAASYGFGANDSLDESLATIRRVAKHPLTKPSTMLQIIGVKTYLDGGMLTGSAYMREPWGVSKIYAIDDPRYRGVRFIEPEKLTALVRETVGAGLQFTAHSVGDGAVHTLLEAYDTVNRDTPIRPTRPCLTHSNFMSAEAVAEMVRLGVVADIQPAWLYLDAHTLAAQFGYERLRYFQPLQSIFAAGGIAGGGSDHMQKIGSLRSINPYNPFLGMWTAITRRSKRYDRPLHPEEALTREQAIRFYTQNNAYIIFQDQNIGSLEAGKLADLVIIDRDILTCEVDDIREIQTLATYLGGKLVYERDEN